MQEAAQSLLTPRETPEPVNQPITEIAEEHTIELMVPSSPENTNINALDA
jgi:hypothetical protein